MVHVATAWLFRKQGVDEAVGVEEFEVVDTFADSDVFDGDAHFLADGDGDSPSSCAVEFGEYKPRAFDGGGEALRLAEAVLPGCCIEHK